MIIARLVFYAIFSRHFGGAGRECYRVSVPDKRPRAPSPILAVVSPLHSLANCTIWLPSCLDLIQHSTGYYRPTQSFS